MRRWPQQGIVHVAAVLRCCAAATQAVACAPCAHAAFAVVYILPLLKPLPFPLPVCVCPPPPPPPGYLRIFRLLWTIKHVDSVLSQCWEHLNSAQRALGALRAAERGCGMGVDNAELVPPMLRAFHARRAEMASFVSAPLSLLAWTRSFPGWLEQCILTPLS